MRKWSNISGYNVVQIYSDIFAFKNFLMQYNSRIKKCSYIQDLELGYCGFITDIAIENIIHHPDLEIGGYYTIP
ncbi:hypothetical protein Glove_44g30 [Diversispora epigaea]|uniref:Uncharacterized protein n=1 Tax=Diversispora epigaea TaxID=1348612 RepID=A0A397JHV6_9GLOM|nr:hypothetical protein Glove_44g30 [Diversispora epigaea]